MEAPARDRDLIQIVDAALAETARKSGAWLVCGPGCTSCCYGSFEITQLDAWRLREGLAELNAADPSRADRLRERVRLVTSELLDDEPCPVLDPATGMCDLYAHRPITCRVFGPPMRVGAEAVGICELCYHGASDDQIAACEVDVDIGDAEAALLAELGEEMTTVAEALGATTAG
jgi:Fe-S-cluster containining protein